MILSDEIKKICFDILDILDSGHPAVVVFTPETDDGAEVCLRYSTTNEFCITSRTFLSKLVLPTETAPVIMELSMADIIFSKSKIEFKRPEHLLDRYVIVVQVDEKVVFRAVIPDPKGSEQLDISAYSRGRWCEDIEIIKHFICSKSESEREYFKGCNNWREVQTRYRNLMKLYHPDSVIGSEEASKTINAQYDTLKTSNN